MSLFQHAKCFALLESLRYICTLKIQLRVMKSEIHPENYRLVAFKDMSNEDIFITKSAAESKETIDVDGVSYPLIKVEISRTSHPFYTGKSKLVDTAGRIDKFKNKYAKFQK
jgi:large subunit ribosomal protein L31